MEKYPDNGDNSLFLTILFSFFTWIIPGNFNLELFIKGVTGLCAVISALMATRYYYYATKVKKKELKETNEN